MSVIAAFSSPAPIPPHQQEAGHPGGCDKPTAMAPGLSRAHGQAGLGGTGDQYPCSGTGAGTVRFRELKWNPGPWADCGKSWPRICKELLKPGTHSNVSTKVCQFLKCGTTDETMNYVSILEHDKLKLSK